MAFRLEDFKKTTRKSTEGGRVPASVYPHQMRDKKALARLEMAIRTFDTLVGKRRGELDAGLMVDFFGDPRLARGVIASLGRFYRYQTPAFAALVGEAAAQRLADNGLTHPMALRAHTFALVNARYDGFLTEAQRAAAYTEIAAPFGLSAHEWYSLLHLDSDENQVLTRPGAPPTPTDLAALYNYHSLETVLRRALRITITGLSLSTVDAADVRTLARHLNVKAVVGAGGGSILLSDLEMSSLLPRRPGRLSRCLLHLLQSFGSKSLSGSADALLGTRTFRLALNTDTLTTLGMISVLPDSRTAARTSFRRRYDVAAELHKDLLKRRAQGEALGWRIARLPEPVVTTAGVLLPDFLLSRGEERVAILLGESREEHWGLPVLTVPLGRKGVNAADVLARAEACTRNLFAVPERHVPEVPAALRALCDRAASTGMVPTSEAQRALHLLDESPLIDWVQRAADPRVHFLPGIGLCSQDLVAAISALSPAGRPV